MIRFAFAVAVLLWASIGAHAFAQAPHVDVCGYPPITIIGAVAADGSGHICQAYVAPDGRTFAQLVAAHVLPDPAVVTGVANPAVNPGNYATTICRHGWTATVRPPVAFTNKLKVSLTPSGYKPSDGEGDHAQSIEDLGMPGPVPLNDPAQVALFKLNFWWEIYNDRYGARVKDRVETKVNRLLCAGKITAKQAHDALLPNWLIGFQMYVGPLPK